MSTTTLPFFCQPLSLRPSLYSTPRLKYKPYTYTSLNRTASPLSTFSFSNNSRFSCFKDENLDYGIPETGGDTLSGGDTVEQEPNRSNVKHDWPLKLRKAVGAIFSAEPWTVPWTAKTILQNWRFSCFKDENLDYGIPETGGDTLPGGDTVEQEPNRSKVKHDWPLKLRKAVDAIFSAEPWTVPWTAKTILQVTLLWIASFWFVGSWIIPFLAHVAGFRKETLTYRGQALYSLLTDVAEGIAGITILHRCLAPFRPLSPDWFKFSFKGKWLFDVGLGCLMFPLVNCLSQVNLNLLPMLPLAPVAVSNVEQSIVARDPVAMALYATVVSVCAPIWEEIVFRGFLLPSLTRYMPLWCSILVSSLAFALAHFNMQRMLPLVFLGIVMGTVYARSRNLLPSMLLHSLWNAFVFIDLMK